MFSNKRKTRNRTKSKSGGSPILETNIHARLWYELINIFDRDIDEPVITQDFTDEEIIGKLSSEKKLEITDLPCHSQSFERSVLLVSEDSHCVLAINQRRVFQDHFNAEIAHEGIV